MKEWSLHVILLCLGHFLLFLEKLSQAYVNIISNNLNITLKYENSVIVPEVKDKILANQIDFSMSVYH